MQLLKLINVGDNVIKICSDTNYLSAFVNDIQVYSCIKNDDQWFMGSSTCLPSNIDLARVYAKAINELLFFTE